MTWDIIVAYLAVCIAISNVVLHYAFFPALDLAIETGVSNPFTRSPIVATFTQLVLGTLIAPVFLLVWLWPGAWAAYVAGTERVVLEPLEI